jgi:hypothetical protein
MTGENWVIKGEPAGALPEVGREYEITDSRKGTFAGKVLEVNGDFAKVDVTKGKPKFMSAGFRDSYDGIVSVRASLATFVPIMNNEKKFNCKCCGKESVYKSNKVAKQAGWQYRRNAWLGTGWYCSTDHMHSTYYK